MNRIYIVSARRRIANPQNTLLQISLASLLLFILACLGRPGGTPSETPTSEGTEAYKSKIEISKVALAKGENYLGGEVYYVEGELTNSGTRMVQRVELTFVFRDSLNQVVLMESRKALEYKGARSLEAQKSARFQVAFDHLPKDWNHVVPEVQVSQVILR
jgi:hypothetical protein